MQLTLCDLHAHLIVLWSAMRGVGFDLGRVYQLEGGLILLVTVGILLPTLPVRVTVLI